MSTVIWNPLLFFWLTRKQKRSTLGGILHTSEIINSLASRVHSLRSTSGGSTTESKYDCKKNKNLKFCKLNNVNTFLVFYAFIYGGLFMKNSMTKHCGLFNIFMRHKSFASITVTLNPRNILVIYRIYF